MLAILGIDLPIERWQHPLARALLDEHYEAVVLRGLRPLLETAGLKPVPSIRELLLAIAEHKSPSRWHFAQAVRSFRGDAAVARTAELEWLASNLNLSTIDCVQNRRELLIRIWFDEGWWA